MPKRIELSDYNLRFDGIIEVQEDRLPELLALGLSPSQLRVFGISDDIRQFNSLSDNPICIVDEDENVTLDMTWLIPEKYKSLDLREYFTSQISEEDDVIMARVQNELQEVKKRGLENLFRTIIYVLDTFREKNVLWGVGRGSSCASYLLFICGLHLVNPIKYNISYSEFFH